MSSIGKLGKFGKAVARNAWQNAKRPFASLKRAAYQFRRDVWKIPKFVVAVLKASVKKLKP